VLLTGCYADDELKKDEVGGAEERCTAGKIPDGAAWHRWEDSKIHLKKQTRGRALD
jgi:hypothetical protein